MFNGKIHYKWSCSIATLNYQRVCLQVGWKIHHIIERSKKNILKSSIRGIHAVHSGNVLRPAFCNTHSNWKSIHSWPWMTSNTVAQPCPTPWRMEQTCDGHGNYPMVNLQTKSNNCGEPMVSLGKWSCFQGGFSTMLVDPVGKIRGSCFLLI